MYNSQPVVYLVLPPRREAAPCAEHLSARCPRAVNPFCFHRTLSRAGGYING